MAAEQVFRDDGQRDQNDVDEGWGASLEAGNGISFRDRNVSQDGTAIRQLGRDGAVPKV